MTPEELATNVRYYRKRSGLSQKALALVAGVGKTVVFDIEKGKASVQLDTLLKVLAVLNIEVNLKVPFVLKEDINEKS